MIVFGSGKNSDNTKFIEVNAPLSDKNFEKNESLEDKLCNILTKVEGVGDVEVFVNYSTKNDKNNNKTNIIYSSDNYNSQLSQSIEGVIIVAQGGGDVNTSSMLRNSISEIMGVPLHKVIVLKMDKLEWIICLWLLKKIRLFYMQ